MTDYHFASDYIPTKEERAFKLGLVEDGNGVSLFEIDRTIRVDVTIIGSKLVERLTEEGVIDRIWNPDRTKVYLLIARNSYTNFNSIPQLLRWVVSPIQPALVIPSFIHDWAVNEWAAPGLVVFKYDEHYYIARRGNNANEIDATSLFDLQLNIGKCHPIKTLGVNFIKWTEAAEVYYKLAKTYKRKKNRVYTYLAYNAVRLAGFFKRAFGSTR